MSVYEFGSGIMTGTRLDVAGLQTPRRFGVLQDVSIDFAGDIKQLFGTNSYPVDAARGKTKIDGKAKFAALQAAAYNDLFFGQTLATGQSKYAYNERTTLGSSTVAINYTVANATSVPLVDKGVFYGGTGSNAGVQLSATTAAPPASASYSFVASTGVYAFAPADSNSVMLINYQYYVSTGYHINVDQQFMGTTPRFSLTLFQIFENHHMVLELYNAISSKLTYPTRIDDYVITEMDFSAFSNAADSVGVWNLAE